MKNKIFMDLTNHILSYGEYMIKERLSVTAKIDYTTNDSKKNFIVFSINSKILKSVNPGEMFLLKEQNYFEDSRQMVKFFIENTFNKHIDLNTNKTFSKYTMPIEQFKKLNTDKLNSFLDESLPAKNEKIKPLKI